MLLSLVMKSIASAIGLALAAALIVNAAPLRGSATADAGDVPAKPTFTKDVLPIFQKSCQSCHRPGQMAPFSLLTYEDARPWARSIKQKVETRYMPPWHLDRTIGEYDPDPSLSDDQIAIDRDAGWTAARRKATRRTRRRRCVCRPTNTWQFGEEPDLIVKSPAFDVPASSADAYPEP